VLYVSFLRAVLGRGEPDRLEMGRTRMKVSFAKLFPTSTIGRLLLCAVTGVVLPGLVEPGLQRGIHPVQQVSSTLYEPMQAVAV